MVTSLAEFRFSWTASLPSFCEYHAQCQVRGTREVGIGWAQLAYARGVSHPPSSSGAWGAGEDRCHAVQGGGVRSRVRLLRCTRMRGGRGVGGDAHAPKIPSSLGIIALSRACACHSHSHAPTHATHPTQQPKQAVREPAAAAAAAAAPGCPPRTRPQLLPRWQLEQHPQQQARRQHDRTSSSREWGGRQRVLSSGRAACREQREEGS